MNRYQLVFIYVILPLGLRLRLRGIIIMKETDLTDKKKEWIFHHRQRLFSSIFIRPLN